MYLKLLLLSFVVAASNASRTPAEIRQWMLLQAMECTKSNFVTSKELQQIMSLELPGTKNSNCFIACVFRKCNWVNDKGQFDIDAANKFVEGEYSDNPTQLENAKKVFDTCKSVNDDAVTDGEEGCERGHNLAKCLIENAPKMGFDLSKM